jgi:DNA processing protein
VEDKVRPENFAMRNRILAGLTPATLVIEAPIRSGALITAHLAFDYNRQVFAIPSDINRVSGFGGNNLIRSQKASLVENVEQILSELSVKFISNDDKIKNYHLDELETKVYSVLLEEPQNLEQIVQKVDIPDTKLLASLVRLEVKGIIYKDFLNTYYVS